MQSGTQAAPVSKKMLWAGYITSALPVLMLLFSGVLKLVKPAPVVDEFARLGYAESHPLGIRILEIVCTVVYHDEKGRIRSFTGRIEDFVPEVITRLAHG